MKSKAESCRKHAETGGITILVVLMLLILLTISAIGLSRNAIRESIIAGTARQGMVVRNIADAGLSWTVFWLDDSNVAASSTGAGALQTKANTLLIRPDLAGQYQALSAGTYSDMSLSSVAGADQEYFDMKLMSMGKLPVLMTSQNVIATNTPSEALFPDLWAARADGHYIQGGAVDFVHSKEVWVSTKARSVNQ